MVIDNDSGTSWPVAIMIAGNVEINFGSVTSIEEITCMVQGSEVINSLPATNNSPKRNHLLLNGLDWIEEFRM